MTDLLKPFDPQPVGDANVYLTSYQSPNGERFYYQAVTEGEGYETQFFHIDGDPLDVLKLGSFWFWVLDFENGGA